jgi:hypothetical protein
MRHVCVKIGGNGRIFALLNTKEIERKKVKQCELHAVLSQSKSIDGQACYFLSLTSISVPPTSLE